MCVCVRVCVCVHMCTCDEETILVLISFSVPVCAPRAVRGCGAGERSGRHPRPLAADQLRLSLPKFFSPRFVKKNKKKKYDPKLFPFFFFS